MVDRKANDLLESFEVLSGLEKGLPARAIGLTVGEFLSTAPTLGEFWTPLLTLESNALSHNIGAMARWCMNRSFELMPHGKTTMAPALWQRQMNAGATGITLATMAQVRTAREFGVNSILLANGVTDPRGLEYLAAELCDPSFRFSCWADSVEAVDLMEQVLEAIPMSRQINVCVELGVAGGRTGARNTAQARAIACKVRDSPVLRLAGVSGYEGALARGRSDAEVSAVRGFLSSMVDLHCSLMDLYDEEETMLTAGGSAFLDVVAEVFGDARQRLPRTRFIVRSGAYIAHDDGIYADMASGGAWGDAWATRGFLQPALRGYARLISMPEPGLALLDIGKRDIPYDEGMPKVISVSEELGGSSRSVPGMNILRMNDQHAFLHLPPDSGVSLGNVVALGVSHPCTAFDKWRYIPVVDDDPERHISSLIHTYF